MKIKFNILATAAALVLASSMASAAINVSTTPDLLFVAYDNNTGATYTRDLGVSLSALSSSATFSAPGGSIFASTFAAVSAANIKWNVYALDNTSPSVYLTGDITQQQFNTDGDVAFVANVLTNSTGALTQFVDPTKGFAKANGEYTGSTTTSDQTNGVTLGKNFGFGNPVSGKGVGSSQNFMMIDSTGVATQLYLNSSLSAFDNNEAGGFFTLLDAQGDLGWTNSNVAPVPLPGAVLLFAPGLLAMFGVSRRRRNSVA